MTSKPDAIALLERRASAARERLGRTLEELGRRREGIVRTAKMVRDAAVPTVAVLVGLMALSLVRSAGRTAARSLWPDRATSVRRRRNPAQIAIPLLLLGATYLARRATDLGKPREPRRAARLAPRRPIAAA